MTVVTLGCKKKAGNAERTCGNDAHITFRNAAMHVPCNRR